MSTRARRPVEDLIGAYIAGMPLASMAQRFGVSKSRIFQLLKRDGVPTRPPLPRPVVPTWNRVPVDQRSTCHPLRRRFRDTRCRECYQLGQANAIGAIDWPVRLVGEIQMGDERVPASCPHCHATPPTWMAGEVRAHCIACGADWFVTVGVLDRRPRIANSRRAVPIPERSAR